MTNDPYMDAINAGAAALAKPYRDPDTISAFVETFPTIAAARVIDAALPHLRATIIAEGVVSGPCPSTTNFKRTTESDGGAASVRMMVALCDLRAGHDGQHEAQSDFGGHYRWTEEPPLAERCSMYLALDDDGIRCERTFQHVGYHIADTYVWNNGGTVVAR